ncbi:hypothetical protein [Actinacidiphila acididurans]|uniref:Uncharacterized protein n=1 Tax=Actinacidiphila acididurans TaxID=2784346 RepID=A0ABS2U273_9ACTN|nr:hypothetical protein [Actinacidiphila acididurans]MBM9508283.1 hypothetical protein [Actinacidiphila acididurans]
MPTAAVIGGLAVTGLVVVATAAVLIVRYALAGTSSADRARILAGVAEVVRAIRGRR